MPRAKLFDFYCTECEAVREDIWAQSTEQPLECFDCGKITFHRAVCNGGLRSRYRFADWPSDPRFYRGQTRITASAHEVGDDGVEKPLKKFVKDGDGGRIDELPKFQDDARAERRDRVYHDTDRKRGTTPLVFDQKKATEPTKSG